MFVPSTPLRLIMNMLKAISGVNMERFKSSSLKVFDVEVVDHNLERERGSR